MCNMCVGRFDTKTSSWDTAITCDCPCNIGISEKKTDKGVVVIEKSAVMFGKFKRYYCNKCNHWSGPYKNSGIDIKKRR